MSKSIAKAYTKEKTDELYTPRLLVELLKPYFDKWLYSNKHFGKYECDFTIWFPFDKETSEYVIFFKETYPSVGIEYSHIDNEQNFFEYEPKHWDIAISNPPFSKKLEVFKRLNSFKKPWVMVMNTMALNYMEIGNYFADNPIQLLIPDKRISFNGNPSSFNSCYVCKNFLPSDLIFVHAEHCNSGENYIPSRMYKD